MKEIFVSYSTVDQAQAETVRNVLEKNGLSCWMAPRDIPGGSNYTKEIPTAIRNCKIFLLILSDNAQNSQWVLKELDAAVNNGKVILPFMLEDCALNDEFNFLLTGAQRYSAYQKKAEAMETLIARIRGILDAEPAKVVPPEAAPEVAPKPAEKKEESKTVVDIFCEAKCPACGSDDLREMKNKVKCQNATEFLTKLLIPLMSVVTMLLLVAVSSFFIPYDRIDLLFLVFAAGLVGGGFWGAAIARNKIKRSRLRKGFSSTFYRCNRCQKKFDHLTPLDN